MSWHHVARIDGIDPILYGPSHSARAIGEVMDVKQAVAVAKSHLISVFGDEMLGEPRLEEIWLEDAEQVWCITLGFFRQPHTVLLPAGTYSKYDYKLVRIDAVTGKPQSIKNRDVVLP